MMKPFSWRKNSALDYCDHFLTAYLNITERNSDKKSDIIFEVDKCNDRYFNGGRQGVQPQNTNGTNTIKSLNCLLHRFTGRFVSTLSILMKRDILWLIGILLILVFALGGGLYFALVAERHFHAHDLNSTRLLVYVFVFVNLSAHLYT